MRSRLPIRGILISTLLLWLGPLLPYSAVARQNTEFSQMGVLAYSESGDLWAKALPQGQALRLVIDEDIASSPPKPTAIPNLAIRCQALGRMLSLASPPRLRRAGRGSN